MNEKQLELMQPRYVAGAYRGEDLTTAAGAPQPTAATCRRVRRMAAVFHAGGPGYRHTDPDTSRQAAEMYPVVREGDRAVALLIHAAVPAGLTDFELAGRMDRSQTSVGKRRGELRDNGYIRNSGQKRPAPSGAKAIVWTITETGQARARDFAA